MKTTMVWLTTGALVIASGGLAHAADVNVDHALSQNIVNWMNQDGENWAGGKWVPLTLTSPATFQWSTSEVVYGPPSGLAPAKPTALESLLAVNCGGPDSQPQVIKMAFKQSVTKTASTTVTKGISASQSLTFSAQVPSWGTGVSETSTVTYSTTTSSTASTAVTYSYSYTDQVTLDPGLKQSATLMVSFQDVVVPWSANVEYVGNDTTWKAVDLVDWSHEPLPEGYANHFTNNPVSLQSVLSASQKTFQAQGTFQGVSASEAQAVNGPTQELTSADKAQYCGGDLEEGQSHGRVFRIPVLHVN